MQFSCAGLRLGKILFDVFVLNRRDKPVQFFDLLGYNVHHGHFVVLREQHGKRQTDIPCSGNSNTAWTHCSFTVRFRRFEDIIHGKTERIGKGEQLVDRRRVPFAFQTGEQRAVDACHLRQLQLGELHCLAA